MASALAAWKKLGHPLPESYFDAELNKRSPQPAQV
jgi:hypothetical protein